MVIKATTKTKNYGKHTLFNRDYIGYHLGH
jgi:hypothetical protein